MIKVERPPNFARIHAAFPDADRKGVLFAYGEDIYNPSGVPIPHWLLAHEYQHCKRQWQQDPEAWWEKYIDDHEFRYREELIAHAAEYVEQASQTKDRNERARLEQRTAARLVAPIYNYVPARSLAQALRDLHKLAHG